MKILIGAYFFPPDSSSGSFRPLHFARYLDQMGEKIYVLTAREQDFLSHQARDHKLLEYLGEGVLITRSRVFHPQHALLALRNTFVKKSQHSNEKTGTSYDKHGFADSSKTSWKQQIKDTITDLFALPDTEIGWLPSAVKAGRTLINEHDIDVIYVTGGPWTSLLVGTLLKKLTGKPLVLDFRDPWVANPIFLIKTTVSRKIEKYLERKVVAAADHIVTNTEELKQDFLSRYRFLDANTLTTITNGFDEYRESQQKNNSRFTILHAGTLIFRNPRFFLQAVINLIEQNRICKEELRIIFLGGISMQDLELDSILKHPLLENILEILPRVPYLEAVEYQKNSDVLFLMQPEEFRLQIPRKLYEYVAFRKTIFAISNPDSATAKIIQEHQLGIVVANQASEMEPVLETLYGQWKNGELEPLSLTTSDKFMNKQLTVSLSDVFHQCTTKDHS